MANITPERLEQLQAMAGKRESIPAGTIIACVHCNNDLWRFRNDTPRESTIRAELLEGIAPLPDPKPSDHIKCAYCGSIGGFEGGLRYNVPAKGDHPHDESDS